LSFGMQLMKPSCMHVRLNLRIVERFGLVYEKNQIHET
jgi:hypothetical protein